jgi:hypothetical protein
MKDTFRQALQARDRARSVMMCLDALQTGTTSVPVLYEDIIAPVLNSLAVPEEQINELIWQEHAMSSIVRSIVEAAYPYVLREREALGLQIARSIWSSARLAKPMNWCAYGGGFLSDCRL